MMTEEKLLFQVSELKQWEYCPRVFYFIRCLPRIRPTTYLMEEGTRAGEDTAGLEERRSLRAYGLQSGTREFNVRVESAVLGLRGILDMIIWQGEGKARTAMPVDFKLSDKVGSHFALQVAAYALLVEEVFDVRVPQGYLYLIPKRSAEVVALNNRILNKTRKTIEKMHEVVNREFMPAPTAQIRKCIGCEFRRFCNDVV
jgi:CRISPR-associated exonuclease Cas4